MPLNRNDPVELGPNVTMFGAEVFKAPVPPICNTALLIVTPPVNVLFPERTSVPVVPDGLGVPATIVPTLTPPASLTTPLMVNMSMALVHENVRATGPAD